MRQRRKMAMKIWTQFHSSGYGAPDFGEYEEFASIRQARQELQRRVSGNDLRFPNVGKDASMVVWTRKPDVDDRDPYPNFLLVVGRRGAIKMEYV